jgi:hypothetical protein
VIDVSAFQMLLLTVTCWLDRREREVVACPDRHANTIFNGLLESGDGLAEVAEGFESRRKLHRNVLTVRAAGTQHYGWAFADRGQRMLEHHDGGIWATPCEL